MTDNDVDDDGIEVVSKYKVTDVNSHRRMLTMDLPLHPLWHYYEVLTYIHTIVCRSYSGTDPCRG